MARTTAPATIILLRMRLRIVRRRRRIMPLLPGPIPRLMISLLVFERKYN
jgi:hypothetical protein